MHVRIVPYDSEWPAKFQAEAQRIRAALGEVAAGVHHIGSTAVPGLSAKPIIDILLEASSLAELDARSERLESLGYEAKGENGISGRRFFRRSDEHGERTHHVHAFDARSAEADRHLAFRDYLIAHPEAAHAYAELKQSLALRFPWDIYAYMAGKDALVKRYEAEGLAWRAQRPMDGDGHRMGLRKKLSDS